MKFDIVAAPQFGATDPRADGEAIPQGTALITTDKMQ